MMILINGISLTNEDLRELNDNNDVIFCAINQNNFLPAETITVIIELVHNVSYNAIYDILKFSLEKLVDFIGNKNENKETKIEVTCDGKKASLNCNFNITKKQKNKFIDAAIKKLLED